MKFNYGSLFRNVRQSISMYVCQSAIPGQTADSHRFPPNFDALNPNLKSVFQNSIQVGPGRPPKSVDFCYFLDKWTPPIS
jgi:hypothetical protein